MKKCHNVSLASCQWGLATALGVGILTEMYVFKYIVACQRGGVSIKDGTNTGPLLLRQGEPGTPQYNYYGDIYTVLVLPLRVFDHIIMSWHVIKSHQVKLIFFLLFTHTHFNLDIFHHQRSWKIFPFNIGAFGDIWWYLMIVWVETMNTYLKSNMDFLRNTVKRELMVQRKAPENLTLIWTAIAE